MRTRAAWWCRSGSGLHPPLRRGGRNVSNEEDPTVEQSERPAPTIQAAARETVHDVNNALNVVLGFLDYLLEDEQTFPEPAELRHYLELIREGAKEALRAADSLRPFYARS